MFIIELNICHFISVTSFDEESACITAGKEFALIRTVGGKVRETLSSQTISEYLQITIRADPVKFM